MSKLEKITLPKRYEYKEGISRPEYKKFNGWNKISYSQNGSFKDYKMGYIQDYILKVGNGKSGNFARFGSACGNYLNPNDLEEQPLLSIEDKILLDKLKENHPFNAEFEYELLISLEPFGLEKTCVQAFTDRQHLIDEKTDILDYKTLTIKTKRAYYESDDYKQLSVYGYGLEELGFKIGRASVTGLGRLGNTIEAGNKNVLRLSGEIIEIEKPYNREKAIFAIKEIVENCKNISDYYKVYNKYFKQ